ncbi:hypothetical protein AB1Y20_001882 [Prymnesium parvum]|uniref:JmjC domain-containing protein n=1 Tax=Prymnesium parvum TaxID=97485 RepID=A0AB34J789_PRYPA
MACSPSDACDAALHALLVQLAIPHLSPSLASLRLDELLLLPRLQLLRHLRLAGVPLSERQSLANAIARVRKGEAVRPLIARQYGAWLARGEVRRVRWDDPRLGACLGAGEPCVICGGCPLTASLVGRWSLEHLAAHLLPPEREEERPRTHFTPRHLSRFTRFYGRGLGAGGVTRRCAPPGRCASDSGACVDERTRAWEGCARVHVRMGSKLSFKEFVAMGAANEARDSPSHRFYAQSPLLWAAADAAHWLPLPKTLCPLGHAAHVPMSAALKQELCGLDWAWLEGALASAGSSGLHSCSLWCGYGGGCTPMHWDSLSNFFTQLVGRKQVLIFPPSQWPNLYPFPFSHPMETYAMVDVEAADLHRFPALARARGLECVLDEGDVLWLPSYYFHHVRQLDEGRPNLSLNCWVGTAQQRVDLGEAALLCSVLAGLARAAYGRVAPRVSDALLASMRASRQAAADEADEALLNHSEAIGLLSLFAAQYLETKARAAESASAAAELNPDEVGPFLNALAAGDDAAPSASSPLGAVGTAKHTLAVQLRLNLVKQFGDAASALLRITTRHGRLHPGPPPVSPEEIVNSEAKQVTASDDLPKEVAHMIQSLAIA